MLKLITAAITALALSACSHNPVFYPTGVVLEDIVEDETFPYVLRQNDPNIACSLGNAFTYFMASINGVTDLKEAHHPMLPLLASICSEYQAREAELHSLRALRKNDIEEAKDARSLQKQWLATTALRRLNAFKAGMRAFDFEYMNDDAQCPDFDLDREEMSFLLSITMATLAIKNDSESDMAVGVPRNIPSAVLQAANCLDNDKWHGVPRALQATLWLLLPDKKPSDISEDNWAILEKASQQSIAAGFRLGNAIHTIAAELTGNKQQLNSALTYYKASADNSVFDSGDYVMVDRMASDFIRDTSNVYWTNEVGYRTPFDQLGDLPPTVQQANSESDEEELDDLL